MKILWMFMLVLTSIFADSISVDPNYARIPVGSNQSFSIRLIGTGRLYDVRVYGPYLSWNQKRVWVSPAGKTETVTFSPLAEGSYTLSIEFGDSRKDITVAVFTPEPIPDYCTDLGDRLQRESDPRAKEIIEDAWDYCNKSKFSMAKLKLEELNDLGPLERELSDGSPLPKTVLLFILAIVSVFSIKLLFT